MKIDRDKVREELKNAGITSDSITLDEIKKLRRIISKHLRRSGIYNGTARISRARKDPKYIEMKTNQWTNREAISFNRDGFIGIAGWADDRNVIPLFDALIEFISCIKSYKEHDLPDSLSNLR